MSIPNFGILPQICYPMQEIFSLLIEETLNCTSCSGQTQTESYRRSLSVDMVHGEKCAGDSETTLEYSLSIESCLDDFFAEKKDTSETPHFCIFCKKDQIYTARKSLKSIGSALIIHIQRYHSSDPYAHIEVPLEIDMSRYCPAAGTYSLRSAIRHFGDGGMGHYTCCAETKEGWRHFNDCYVLPLSMMEYLSSSMLFIYVKSAS